MTALFIAFSLGFAQQEGPRAPEPPPLFSGRMVNAHVAGTIRELHVADLDGDGHQDVVTSCGAVTTSLGVLLGDGRGGLHWSSSRQSPASAAGYPSVSTAAVLDVDGDGALDVASGGLPDSLQIFAGDGSGALLAPYRVPVPGTMLDVQAADMNRDGL